MKLNSVKYIGKSPMVNMGPVQLKQPIPNGNLQKIDPFILLHHYGPYKIDERNNPFDLGPHPHRGFEPITFLIQGEQLHKDSLGNESVVKSGDVQWTTAGRGVIHSEGPTKDFVKKGGYLEGIQLWLNLPASKKMMPANYQHVKNDDFLNYQTTDGLANLQVIAGSYHNLIGKIETQTPVNAYLIDIKKNGEISVPLDQSHQSLIYLLNGKVDINNEDTLELNNFQLIEFNNDTDEFTINAKEDAKLLFLSGEPLNEKVASWGPYVMNTQTEIMEAMRDYQQGKMGYLAR